MTAPNGSLLSAPPEVRGKRVLVYSLGIEGRDLAGWLLANGATVVISDTRSDEALAAARALLGDAEDLGLGFIEDLLGVTAGRVESAGRDLVARGHQAPQNRTFAHDLRVTADVRR